MKQREVSPALKVTFHEW